MDDLISIIVPIYETEQLALDYCLYCIKNQTYSNIEVICVDGGSSSNTLEVLDKYKLDKRFKFLNSSQGVSHQRNVGLSASKGEYIIFVDSDDFFNFNFIYSLYKALKKSKSDVAIPLIHRCVFKDNILIENIPYNVSQINESVNQNNFFKYCQTGELVNPVKLYKLCMVKDIRFVDYCSYGEDLLFNYEVSKKTYKSIFVPDAIYNYRKVMNHNSTDRRLDARGLYIVKALAKIIKSKEIKSKEAIVGLYEEFDYVFREFYYSLAKNKRISGLIWMIKYKPLYLKNHHNIHDILFLIFPILIVSRRNRRSKKLYKSE